MRERERESESEQGGVTGYRILINYLLRQPHVHKLNLKPYPLIRKRSHAPVSL